MAMGTFSLLFGYHTRHGAVMLFGMTIVATVVLHDYWHFADPAARRASSTSSRATLRSAAGC